MAKKTKTAEAKSPPGTPFDYFVVVDAGSHGSRVFVYRWLNPQLALENGLDLRAPPKVSLIREFAGEETDSFEDFNGFSLASRGDSKPKPSADADSDSDSDSDSGSDSGSGSGSGSGSNSGSNSDSSDGTNRKYVLPNIGTKKKWHLKIEPGVSTFNESPQKVGKHHLSHLLHLAGKVVPKSEHRRTPFFFHATAGMRLLPPNESEPIIENICRYVAEESDFFMPDCSTHVNVIDGNIEGLYGWLAINQMVGSFDNPEQHQHGKNHTTYGLLDMGGASTQVVFQPNQTEIDEHLNNMYRVTLNALPELRNQSVGQNKRTDQFEDHAHARSEKTGASSYAAPRQVESNVYSGSYLGFGMFQARAHYLKTLLQEFRRTNDLPNDTFRFRTPVPDPCVPKGYTFSGEIDDHDVDFTGNSNFNECLESIFPVLANNTYNSDAEKYHGDCKKLDKEQDVSSCLLNDLIPSIDFSINHFIGVSGYWDTINSLFESQMPLPSERSSPDKPQEKYDYDLIYSKTQKLCSSSLNELLEMNLSKKMKQEELADLCFRSSWILNFLHVGLGFPRFGIDDTESQDKFKSLELVDKVGGSSFSWTLGRAMLYANDEYTQAYNNYTVLRGGEPLPRPGYTYPASESFAFGAEANGIEGRPAVGTETESDVQYDYEKEDSPVSSSWTIKPHRLYGEVIFFMLLSVVVLLMFGKKMRIFVISAVPGWWNSLKRRFGGYSRLVDSESGRTSASPDEPIEMSSIQAHQEDLFEVGEA